jgi:transketolase
VAYANLNVKVCATHAGITVGEDGGSHQSIEDISLMRSIPGMTVLSPADATEAEKMVFAAAQYNGPVYIRFGRLNTPVLFDESYDFKIGKINTIRDGGDVTIAATGMLVAEAMEAAKKLKEEGISARVLNVGTIKPLDKDAILKAAKETKFILTAEEHSVIGGLGSAVSEYLSEIYPTKVVKIGINDQFGQSGDGAELMKFYGLSSENIVEKIKSGCKYME